MIRFLIISGFLSLSLLGLQCQTEKPIVRQNRPDNSPRAETKPIDSEVHFEIESASMGNASEVSTFSPTLSKVPLERNPDTFSPELFANTTYPTSFNKDLGFYLPNWIITLQTDLSMVYEKKRIPLRSKGVWGSVDYKIHHREGSDWNFYLNPDNGQPYREEYSPRTRVKLSAFVSALPIEQRVQFNMTDLRNWDKKSEAQLAQMGRDVVRGTEFGDHNKPWKQTLGLVDFDWENNYENGPNPRIALRFIKSACDNLQGIFQAMYVHPINAEVGNLSKNGYPDANGNVSRGSINPIYTSQENLDGMMYRVTDSKNFAPLLETSHYGESTMHGFNDGVRLLNAYGSNANIEHYLARVTSMAEKNYSYLHSIGKDLCFIQAKLICDRGNGWQYPNGNVKGEGSKALPFSHYLTRDQAFKSTMAVFFSGLHIHEWKDRKSVV